MGPQMYGSPQAQLANSMASAQGGAPQMRPPMPGNRFGQLRPQAPLMGGMTPGGPPPSQPGGMMPPQGMAPPGGPPMGGMPPPQGGMAPGGGGLPPGIMQGLQQAGITPQMVQQAIMGMQGGGMPPRGGGPAGGMGVGGGGGY